MECELCDKHIHKIRRIQLEGATIMVCDDCVSYGTEVMVPSAEPKRSANRYMQKPIKTEEEDLILVDNLSAVIRKAREKLGKTQGEFAQYLQEKESVIRKLESGNIHIDDALINKLEKKLNITLREKVDF